MMQRTDEWYQARLGRVTASKIADVMAGGQGKSRQKYLYDLVGERLSGKPVDGYTSKAMEMGILNEPSARNAYELISGQSVEEVGFIEHPFLVMAGASPDGMVNPDGLLEIKCQEVQAHIEFLETGKISGKYVKQMQFQMDCTERDWCDFVSYCPAMSLDLQADMLRVERDDDLIEKIRDAVREFEAEVTATVERLRARGAA